MKFLIIALNLFIFFSCKNVINNGNNSTIDSNYHPGMNSQDLLAPQTFNLSLDGVGDTSISLSWGNSTYSTNYQVKYGTTSGLYDTVYSTNATSPITITGLTNGVNYYFRVEAQNINGIKDSNTEIQAMPMTPPTTPSTLAISGTAPYTINLSWTNEGGLGTITYNLYRSLTSGSGYSLIATSIGSLAYSDTGLVGGQTYYYLITAHNEGGTSGYSNEVMATSP